MENGINLQYYHLKKEKECIKWIAEVKGTFYGPRAINKCCNYMKYYIPM